MKFSKKQEKPEKQLEKFIKAARELGCEENSDRYDDLVKKVGEQKPQPRKPKKGKK